MALQLLRTLHFQRILDSALHSCTADVIGLSAMRFQGERRSEISIISSSSLKYAKKYHLDQF